MKRSDLRPRLAALLTAIVVSVGGLCLSSAPAWAAAGTITEFPPNGSSFGMTAGPDGNLWFTEESNTIGRITTGGSVTQFHLSTHCGHYPCDPYDITSASDGNLWFTDYLGNFIERLTTAGSLSVFPIPTTNSRPTGITAGPDGNVWFSESASIKVGRITTS